MPQITSNTAFSLQRKLLKNTILSGVITSVLSALLVVFMVGYDNHDVMDEMMKKQALVLLSDSDLQKYEDYHDELGLSFQIKDGNQTIGHLPHQISQNIAHDEFDNVYADGAWWRVYKTTKDARDITIAQPWLTRYESLFEGVEHTLWMMMVLVLLSMIGMWHTVRQALNILGDTCQKIAQKNIDDLSPIHQTPMFVELSPMIQSVNHLLSRLGSAINNEKRFTADAAHELRTPLAAIDMKLQLMRRKYPDRHEMSADFDELQNDIKRATSLVHNLLLLARLDPARHDDLPKDSIDVAALLAEISTHTNQLIDKHHKAIDFTMYNQLPNNQTLHGNYELIFTALRNLMDNAVRYHKPAGRIVLRAELAQEGAQSFVKFIIQDDGEGVDLSKHSKLGERFFRASNCTEGSGLGLSIVQKIVALHHGYMQFGRGIDDTGLSVTLYLAL